MADVLEVKRKHYSGLDADKAGITGVLGDTYAANDSGKAYYWNDALSAWKTGLGYEFVPRRAADIDKTLVDFTTDGNYKINGLDLSGIVPAGAVAVALKVALSDDAANSFFHIRTNATDSDENTLSSRTQVATITIYNNGVIPIDSDRLLDYQGSNLVFIAINVTVIGWWI